jgi:hypothetical protein
MDRVSAEALALVWMDRVEDIVKFERVLIQEFGRSTDRFKQMSFATLDFYQRDTKEMRVSMQFPMDRLIDRVGLAPGQHCKIRFPV